MTYNKYPKTQAMLEMQFANIGAIKVSHDCDFDVCSDFIVTIQRMIGLKLSHRIIKELWILLNYGPKVLKNHRRH